MKFAVNFLLILFITFLATPTIVTLCEKNSDISIFYKFSEEEIHKELKEVKAFTNKLDSSFLLSIQKKDSKINSDVIWFHNNTSQDIFIPPPELV